MKYQVSHYLLALFLNMDIVAYAQLQIPAVPPSDTDYRTDRRTDDPIGQAPPRMPQPQFVPELKLPLPQQTLPRDVSEHRDGSFGGANSTQTRRDQRPTHVSSEMPYRGTPQYTRKPLLWDRRQSSKAYLFYDTQARSVGDLITVLVSENTDVENRDQRALDKASSSTGLFNFSSSAGGDFGSTAGLLQANGKTSSDRAFDGSAAFSSARQFNDRVTATVVHVFPNGNLLVQGKRNVSIAGDQRLLAVSGIVRPFDVRADNTIESRFIGNFEVEYEGDGVETQFTKQGWLSRLTNKVWPY